MATRRDLPRLWSLSEIRERTGWSRQWASAVVGSKGFPDEVYVLGGRRIWLTEEVEAWLAANRAELAEPAEG